MEDSLELDGVLAADGAKKNRLVIQLGEFEGMRLLNIRRWFVDGRSGAWMPTRKGISLSLSAFRTVLNALKDNEAQIASWLSSSVETSAKVRMEHERQVRAAVSASHAGRPFEVRVEKWVGPEFFRVDGAGGSDVLVLNDMHNVSGPLRDGSLGRDATLALLVAFARACRLIDGGSDNRAAEQIQLLVANWAFLLRQYMRQTR